MALLNLNGLLWPFSRTMWMNILNLKKVLHWSPCKSFLINHPKRISTLKLKWSRNFILLKGERFFFHTRNTKLKFIWNPNVTGIDLTQKWYEWMKRDPFSLVLKWKVHYFYIYGMKNRKFIISFINNLKISKYWVSFSFSKEINCKKGSVMSWWCVRHVHVKIMIELILYFFSLSSISHLILFHFR